MCLLLLTHENAWLTQHVQKFFQFTLTSLTVRPSLSTQWMVTSPGTHCFCVPVKQIMGELGKWKSLHSVLLGEITSHKTQKHICGRCGNHGRLINCLYVLLSEHRHNYVREKSTSLVTLYQPLHLQQTKLPRKTSERARTGLPRQSWQPLVYMRQVCLGCVFITCHFLLHTIQTHLLITTILHWSEHYATFNKVLNDAATQLTDLGLPWKHLIDAGCHSNHHRNRTCPV